MIDKVNKEVVSFLFKGELPMDNSNEIQEARNIRKPKENLKTTKEDIQNSDELSAQNRAIGKNQGERPQITETIVRKRAKIGRNDRVTIKNIASSESRTLKYKQAVPLISKGDWVLISEEQLI